MQRRVLGLKLGRHDCRIFIATGSSPHATGRLTGGMGLLACCCSVCAGGPSLDCKPKFSNQQHKDLHTQQGHTLRATGRLPGLYSRTHAPFLGAALPLISLTLPPAVGGGDGQLLAADTVAEVEEVRDDGGSSGS